MDSAGSQRRWWCAALAVLAGVLAAGAAAGPDGAFEEANRLYEEGQYTNAAVAYAALLADGRGPAALHFNLGNAQFKAGRVGLAIYQYRLALRQAPRDPDIRANLQFARGSVQGGGWQPGRWERWLTRLTLDEHTALAAGLFWAWLGLLIAGQLRPRVWRNLRGLAMAAAGLSLVAVVGVLASLRLAVASPMAIVVSPESAVRYGPLEESRSAFVLRDGAEARVLDRKNDWLQILDHQQRTGWVRASDVLIFPPER